MSKGADNIRRGLKEAVAYAEGKADERAYRIHVPRKIDVKAIRTRLGMTQEEFNIRRTRSSGSGQTRPPRAVRPRAP